MITIGFSTRKIDNEFISHLKETCGIPKVEILPVENSEGISLTQVYNELLDKATNDIVILCHDDIYFDTRNWGKRILNQFKRNPDYGILGVAGTTKVPESGKWWDDFNKMRGIVNHEHQNKKWESKYSENIGNKIDDVAIVDGVFIVINKNKINHLFNPDVNGFHFYDVDFCLTNKISGVRIGVIYDVRITHKSIGITNDSWEKNREQFILNHKEHLPYIVYDDFKNRKLKVLLGVLNFQGLTGSEVSTLELAKELSQSNCDVSIISSQVSDTFKKICNRYGIKTYTISDPPGYKMGDGIWGLNTPNGFQVSQKNQLYRIGNINQFDVIQTNHTPITNMLLQLYPTSKFVTIVRSEIIDLENPIVDDRVYKYIVIRPKIKDYLINEFGINEDSIEIIYNIFDTTKFKKVDRQGENKKTILFVGTMDYLRKQSIEDIISKLDNNSQLWLVGNDTMGYGKEFADRYENVSYFEPTNNIEDFYHRCDETAGIMLGRTTIEGYLCGKPGWIYTVDKEGNILDVEFTEVPNDLEIFSKDNIIKQYLQLYLDTYNS